MKKNVLFLIASLFFIFSSCKKEDDSEILGDTYYPIAKGTERVYKVTDGNTTTRFTETMTGNTATFNGLTYYEAESKQNGTNLTAKSYYHENNGVYKVRSTTFHYEIVLEFELLHSEDAIGSTWTKNVTSSGTIKGVPARIVGTLKEKNISKDVLGKSYKNVSHATVELQYDMGDGFETAATYEFYLAKGVGIIRTDSQIDYFGFTVTSKSELESYTLK